MAPVATSMPKATTTSPTTPTTPRTTRRTKTTAPTTTARETKTTTTTATGITGTTRPTTATRRSEARKSGRKCGWSWLAVLLLVVLLLADCELGRHRAEAFALHRRFYRQSVRLCSRSLSDALYMLCKDRGYNEPFTSSSEDVRHTNGPGLVEECCYNSCSIEQMEQYCKPKRSK